MTTAAVPTVADTKRSFLQNNPKPLPGLYTPIVNELLVQQHLIVFNKTYTHDPVSSLGLLSVWDGVMEGAPNIDSEAVLKALLESLERDPQEYRADAALTSPPLLHWPRCFSVSRLASGLCLCGPLSRLPAH